MKLAETLLSGSHKNFYSLTLHHSVTFSETKLKSKKKMTSSFFLKKNLAILSSLLICH